jgi:dTDP-4-amino-4,6-dideoxygalactose transaminase
MLYYDTVAPDREWTRALRSASTAVLKVPFLDLGRIHAPLAATLERDFRALVVRGAFVNGAEVQAFERAFSAYCSSPHCVGVSSGLDALRLALLAQGINRGAEVLVPANTFAATVEAVVQAGARPVVVDVDATDFNMDMDAAAAAISPRTEAIVPVHLYGQMAEPTALRRLAQSHGLFVLEDASQAHGAEREGIRPGAAGDAAAFSFYPGKNLGAMGDAGALVCRDPELAARVRALREHGQTSKYHHEYQGWTARLDTIQAIVLLRKLPLLDGWNAERSSIAARYRRELAGVGDLVLPGAAVRSSPVWHLYVIQTADPNALAEHLLRCGVGSGRHYPEPIHLLPAYRELGYREGAFPVAERFSRSVLSLPIFPGMRETEVELVLCSICGFFGDA